MSNGLWSEVTKSITPSFSAALKAATVAASRNGGNTL